MTPEQLLGLPAPVEQLTDEQLEQHLAKFFPYTRPKKPIKHVTQKIDASLGTLTATSKSDALRQALAAAFKAQGLDPSGKPLPKTSKAHITTVYKA